jgi:hypothetical protein
LEGGGDIVVFYLGGESVDDGGLAYTGFSYKEWIVLVLATEHLNGAIHLFLSADEGVVMATNLVHATDEGVPLVGLVLVVVGCGTVSVIVFVFFFFVFVIVVVEAVGVGDEFHNEKVVFYILAQVFAQGVGCEGVL